MLHYFKNIFHHFIAILSLLRHFAGRSWRGSKIISGCIVFINSSVFVHSLNSYATFIICLVFLTNKIFPEFPRQWEVSFWENYSTRMCDISEIFLIITALIGNLLYILLAKKSFKWFVIKSSTNLIYGTKIFTKILWTFHIFRK